MRIIALCVFSPVIKSTLLLQYMYYLIILHQWEKLIVLWIFHNIQKFAKTNDGERTCKKRKSFQSIICRLGEWFFFFFFFFFIYFFFIFRTLTAKVWANLDNQFKSYDISKFWLIDCMPPSQLALYYKLCYHNRMTCLNELYTHFIKCYSSWKYFLCSTFLLRYVKTEMIVHAFMKIRKLY